MIRIDLRSSVFRLFHCERKMFHKYNSMTNTLSAADQLSSYRPEVGNITRS